MFQNPESRFDLIVLYPPSLAKRETNGTEPFRHTETSEGRGSIALGPEESSSHLPARPTFPHPNSGRWSTRWPGTPAAHSPNSNPRLTLRTIPPPFRKPIILRLFSSASNPEVPNSSKLLIFPKNPVSRLSSLKFQHVFQYSACPWLGKIREKMRMRAGLATSSELCLSPQLFC